MKASQRNKSGNVINNYGSEQASFGEIRDHKDSGIPHTITSIQVMDNDNTSKITLGMFEDVSIPQKNIAFLKLASHTFNKIKSPQMTIS